MKHELREVNDKISEYQKYLKTLPFHEIEGADNAFSEVEHRAVSRLIEGLCVRRDQLQMRAKLKRGNRNCIDCGDPISLKRLGAVPGTELCLGCAQDRELRLSEGA